MIYVEKGFSLKGFTIGEMLDGKMIIGIDNSDICICDIAVLSDEPTTELQMIKCDDDDIGGTVYGLEEYKNSEFTEWKSSFRYKNRH